jgi:hypothetical protein
MRANRQVSSSSICIGRLMWNGRSPIALNRWPGYENDARTQKYLRNLQRQCEFAWMPPESSSRCRQTEQQKGPVGDRGLSEYDSP